MLASAQVLGDRLDIGSLISMAILLCPFGEATANPAASAVVVLGARPQSAAHQKARQLVQAHLKGRKDIALIDPARVDARFAAVPPDNPKIPKKTIKRLLGKAENSLGSFQLKAAETNFARASEKLMPFVGLRATEKLDLWRLQVGVAIAHTQRNDAQLKALLAEYALRHSKAKPPKLWPPDLVRSAQEAAPGAGGDIIVKTTPPGKVYIDGREVGTSPLTVKGLPAGRHRVEVVAPGYFEVDAWARSAPRASQTVKLQLKPALSSALAASKSVDPALQDTLLKAMETEKINLLFLARPGPKLTLRFLERTEKGPKLSSPIQVDNSPTGVKFGIEQLMTARRGPDSTGGAPAWAWVGAGGGAVAVGVGVAMRLLAVSTQNNYESQQGAITQVRAFELQDRANVQATSGAVLLGVGSAALAGFAGWLVFESL